MMTRSDNVAVIAGGLSHEREVSLHSGQQVAEGLKEAGYTVQLFDVDHQVISHLQASDCSVVFPVLHGSVGEDGAIQTVCEALHLPYVGTTASAAHLTFDKFNAKQTLQQAGINVPASFSLTESTLKLVGAANLLPHITDQLGYPLVVKPQQGGSSLGLSVVHHAEELTGALIQAFAYARSVLLEQHIAGKEVSVTVVDGLPGWSTLPPVEIRTGDEGYDYAARYTAGESTFIIPARCDAEVINQLIAAGETAHRSLGLRDYSRTDFIVDANNQPWYLESNISPGMTVNSLLPQAVTATGRSLADLCDALVQAAINRKHDGL